ncbi:hypothetical protein P154DRAFT_412046, partial [Amniculicola lignicola CBS 123094]
WITSYLTKYMDSDNQDPKITQMFKDYAKFKDKIRQTFAVPGEPAIAERAIQRLRQTKSAGDYA